MRATSRCRHTLDPLAGPGAVRGLYQILRDQLLALIPPSEKKLWRLLEAVRHLARRPSTDSRRGRPPRFRREDLWQAACPLRFILKRETGVDFARQLRQAVFARVRLPRRRPPRARLRRDQPLAGSTSRPPDARALGMFRAGGARPRRRHELLAAMDCVPNVL